jgi:hypothetical protein
MSASETPRTNFVAHESGDVEWNKPINRFGRMMAHACILERELAAENAKLAEYQSAKMPEPASMLFVDEHGLVVNGGYIDALSTHCRALTVRAEAGFREGVEAAAEFCDANWRAHGCEYAKSIRSLKVPE